MNEIDFLDVEDDEHRQKRIRILLEKLNSESKAETPSRFNFRDRSTFAVEPPSELISRVQAFLPRLQASNEALAQRAQENPESVNIEHINDDTDRYIEMNLGLGVFEQRCTDLKAREQEAEMSTSSSSPSSETPGVNQDDTDTESDMSSEIITSFVPARPVRPLPRRSLNKSRPQITVLEDKPHT